MTKKNSTDTCQPISSRPCAIPRRGFEQLRTQRAHHKRGRQPNHRCAFGRRPQSRKFLRSNLSQRQGAVHPPKKAQARLETELEIGKLTYLAEFESQLKNKEFRNKVAQLETLADYFGFEGDGKKSFVIAEPGIKKTEN